MSNHNILLTYQQVSEDHDYESKSLIGFPTFFEIVKTFIWIELLCCELNRIKKKFFLEKNISITNSFRIIKKKKPKMIANHVLLINKGNWYCGFMYCGNQALMKQVQWKS